MPSGSRSSQQGAADLETAANAGNDDGVAAANTALNATCGACHMAHRERLPDMTFRIGRAGSNSRSDLAPRKYRAGQPSRTASGTFLHTRTRRINGRRVAIQEIDRAQPRVVVSSNAHSDQPERRRAASPGTERAKTPASRTSMFDPDPRNTSVGTDAALNRW